MTAIIRKEVIGPHTLIQGDSMEVLKELPPIEYLVSDPPYGMAFKSNHRSEETMHKAIANDENADLLLATVELDATIAKIIFCRWDNLYDVPKPKSLITWVKSNHSMGDLKHEFGRKTEVALFYTGPEHKWLDKRPVDVIYAPRTGNKFHPTEKPISLMETVVSWHGGIVCDPFMGSGSTIVACANLDRPSIGIELDPDYFDIACKRVRDAYEAGSVDDLF